MTISESPRPRLQECPTFTIHDLLGEGALGSRLIADRAVCRHGWVNSKFVRLKVAVVLAGYWRFRGVLRLRAVEVKMGCWKELSWARISGVVRRWLW